MAPNEEPQKIEKEMTIRGYRDAMSSTFRKFYGGSGYTLANYLGHCSKPNQVTNAQRKKRKQERQSRKRNRRN